MFVLQTINGSGSKEEEVEEESLRDTIGNDGFQSLLKLVDMMYGAKHWQQSS